MMQNVLFGKLSLFRKGADISMKRYLGFIGLLTLVLLTVFSLSVEASSTGTVITFSSLDNNNPSNVSGTLYLPENSSAPCPAVVMIHGTAGPDVRYDFHRDSILQAGIAVFAVDFKTGVFTGPSDRPRTRTFVPMAFAALKELRKLPAIDPERIGIMGFSLGGGVTITTAIDNNRALWMGDEKGFAAHAAFYPCARFFIPKLSNPTGAPMIIFYGTEDCYGDGESVPVYKRLLWENYNFNVITVEYPGAHHGFNRNVPAINFYDPSAIDQKGYTEWNENAAIDSRTKVVDFLRETLATK